MGNINSWQWFEIIDKKIKQSLDKIIIKSLRFNEPTQKFMIIYLK